MMVMMMCLDGVQRNEAGICIGGRARGQRLFGEAGAAKTRKDTAGRRAPTWARPGSRGRSSVDADPLATLFLFSGGEQCTYVVQYTRSLELDPARSPWRNRH